MRGLAATDATGFSGAHNMAVKSDVAFLEHAVVHHVSHIVYHFMSSAMPFMCISRKAERPWQELHVFMQECQLEC